jgi:hypothetical protein
MNRMKQHRNLQEVNTYHVKDKDLQSFQEIEIFDRIIINEYYVIHKSRIFYTRPDKPYSNGILDYEDLSVLYLDQ